MPEAGTGSAETLRISAAGAAGGEANRLGAGLSVDRGVPEVGHNGGEYRVSGTVFCLEELGVQGSDGTRGRRISGVGTGTAGGGE